MTISTATTAGQILTSAYVNNNINSGLVYIDSVTVTASLTATFENCFSSTYRDYQVIVDVTGGSANTELEMYLRVASTNAITNYNYSQFGTLPNGTANNSTTGASDTKVPITFIPATQQISASYFIGQPNVAAFSSFNGPWVYDDGGTSIHRTTIGRHRTATAYTGLQIKTGSTWTGLVTVYGYRIA
jgi:hypothetical protein